MARPAGRDHTTCPGADHPSVTDTHRLPSSDESPADEPQPRTSGDIVQQTPVQIGLLLLLTLLALLVLWVVWSLVAAV